VRLEGARGMLTRGKFLKVSCDMVHSGTHFNGRIEFMSFKYKQQNLLNCYELTGILNNNCDA